MSTPQKSKRPKTAPVPVQPVVRRWCVTRVVHEYFQVFAVSRQEAKDKAEDPSSVAIVRESATLSDDQTDLPPNH